MRRQNHGKIWYNQSLYFKGKPMKYSKSFLLLLSFAMINVSIDAGTLKGHVKYDGKAPKKKRLRMDADPVCGSSHSGPVYSENTTIHQ